MNTYDYILQNRSNQNRKPSLKALESAFPGKGKALRNLFEDNLAVWNHDACQRWMVQCFNQPSMEDLRMFAIDSELENHGVEYIQAGKNRRSPAIEYSNAGDTYAVTICRVNGKYRICCIGDIIEKGNYE